MWKTMAGSSPAMTIDCMPSSIFVITGLDPVIAFHVEDDGRIKSGHDDEMDGRVEPRVEPEAGHDDERHSSVVITGLDPVITSSAGRCADHVRA
jgi:hypothetical protein